MRYQKLVIIIEDEEGRFRRVLLSGAEADQVADLVDKLHPHGLKTIRFISPELVPWYRKLLNYVQL